MRKTRTISISLPPKLLEQAESLAEKLGWTKSKLFRESLRCYILEEDWRELQRYGARQARKLGIKETDVERLIAEYRYSKYLS